MGLAEHKPHRLRSVPGSGAGADSRRGGADGSAGRSTHLVPPPLGPLHECAAGSCPRTRRRRLALASDGNSPPARVGTHSPAGGCEKGGADVAAALRRPRGVHRVGSGVPEGARLPARCGVRSFCAVQAQGLTGGAVWRQATNENISPSVLNRLIKEVKEYTKNPVSDIVLQVNEANVTDIRADLHGPGIRPAKARRRRAKQWPLPLGSHAED